MKKLRFKDYEKFLWLCEELQIKYIPIPEYTRRIPKRTAERNTIRKAALALRKEKLATFQKQLEEQRKVFNQHKEKEMEFIGKELADLALDEKSPIVQVYQALKAGRVELEEHVHNPPGRRRMILEKKFELHEKRLREKQLEAAS